MTSTLADLLRQLREPAHAERAATELVKRFEPIIRRELRFRLHDRRLARLFDSLDVCQSVLASFFAGCALGRFNLDEPAELSNLLIGMARIKLAFEARKQKARRRDYRRHEGGEEHFQDLTKGPSPSRVVQARQLLEVVRARLGPEERKLADLRSEGHAWPAIARQVGGTPNGRRMQLARALGRIARDLGLEEGEGGHDA